MQLGRASALAVFAATHLAGEDLPVQGGEIAASLGVPADHLTKILQQLVDARILTGLPGPGGGFKLRSDPGTITLLSIVEAVEGSVEGGHARELLIQTTIRDLAGG